MTKLDRALQRSILESLANVYPGIAHIRPSEGETQEDLNANLYYLAEHGLVTVQSQLIMAGTMSLGTPSITARGMDFLADDGGLSAILGVVTVKLHDDTIRQLLINRIEKASGDGTIKGQLIAKVRGLPAEALGRLMTEGLDAALAKAPDLLDFLSSLLR